MFFSPHILDIVIPLNESRERWHFPDSLEYFIDQEKHLYLLAVYLFLVILVGMNTALATETASMTFVQHICAMFSITRWLDKIKENICDSIHLQRVFFQLSDRTYREQKPGEIEGFFEKVRELRGHRRDRR